MPLTKDGHLYTGYEEKSTKDLIELTKPSFNKKLKEFTKKAHRTLLTHFVQQSIDNKRIIMMDKIFDYIDEYLEEIENE